MHGKIITALAVALSIYVVNGEKAIAQSSPAMLRLGRGETVVDSTGKFVGYLIGYGQIEMQLNGVWYAFGASNSNFSMLPGANALLFFTSAGCTGPVYMNSSTAETTLPRTGIFRRVSPNNEVIFYYPSGPTQQVHNVMSAMYAGGDGTDTTCIPTSGTADNVMPLTGVPASKLGLVPPFSIK